MLQTKCYTFIYYYNQHSTFYKAKKKFFNNSLFLNTFVNNIIYQQFTQKNYNSFATFKTTLFSGLHETIHSPEAGYDRLVRAVPLRGGAEMQRNPGRQILVLQGVKYTEHVRSNEGLSCWFGYFPVMNLMISTDTGTNSFCFG